MSPEILEAMKFRDRHKALGNENEYKIWIYEQLVMLSIKTCT